MISPQRVLYVTPPPPFLRALLNHGICKPQFDVKPRRTSRKLVAGVPEKLVVAVPPPSSAARGVVTDQNVDQGQISGQALDTVRSLNARDAAAEYSLESMSMPMPTGYGDGVLSQIRSRTRSPADHTLISWEVDDPENPHNWSTVS